MRTGRFGRRHAGTINARTPHKAGKINGRQPVKSVLLFFGGLIGVCILIVSIPIILIMFGLEDIWIYGVLLIVAWWFLRRRKRGN